MNKFKWKKMHALGFSPICSLLPAWLARKHVAFWSPDCILVPSFIAKQKLCPKYEYVYISDTCNLTS